jgi:hypothetical protein
MLLNTKADELEVRRALRKRDTQRDPHEFKIRCGTGQRGVQRQRAVTGRLETQLRPPPQQARHNAQRRIEMGDRQVQQRVPGRGAWT